MRGSRAVSASVLLEGGREEGEVQREGRKGGEESKVSVLLVTIYACVKSRSCQPRSDAEGW